MQFIFGRSIGEVREMIFQIVFLWILSILRYASILKSLQPQTHNKIPYLKKVQPTDVLLMLSC